MKLPAMNGPVSGLRDIHLPQSPGWWPPAPGWWVLAIVLVIASIALVRSALRLLTSRRRIRNALRDFDNALAAVSDSPERLAAASQMLRRAAKIAHPAAALFAGDAWLRFLDGDHPLRPFSNDPGRLLRDGGFQRSVQPDIEPTLRLARMRFVELLNRGNSMHQRARKNDVEQDHA